MYEKYCFSGILIGSYFREAFKKVAFKGSFVKFILFHALFVGKLARLALRIALECILLPRDLPVTCPETGLQLLKTLSALTPKDWCIYFLT
jgi:hypothetical protein